MNGLYYLWKKSDISIVIREIIETDWNSNALGLIINGRCFRSILNDNKTLESKLYLLHELFGFIFK